MNQSEADISGTSPATPMTNTPTNIVLIVSDNAARADAIKTQLKRLNFLTKDSVFDGIKLNGVPKSAPDIILLALTDYIEKAPTIVEGLKSHFNKREIPFLGTLSRKADIDTSCFESVIYPPAHASQIAKRVDSLIRLSGMEREIMRRIMTLKESFDIDYRLEETALSRPFKILFVGKPTPEFMVVINALQEKNVEVVAAFTTFSAFDYLYEKSFNAVVMNALVDVEPPLSISATMRKNAKLYHVPTLLLVDGETFDQEKRAFEKGARDLIDAKADLEEISGRILELANYHRIHSQLKQEFDKLGGDNCIDTPSGTFNDTFFYAHLRRICRELGPQDIPVTLVAVKIWPNAPFPVSSQEVSDACAKVGSMIKNLVRMEDITARIEDDTYLLAFSNETESSIAPVIERISAIVDCAAFATSIKDQGPFTVQLNIAAVSLAEGENSDFFAGRALAAISKESGSHLKVS